MRKPELIGAYKGLESGQVIDPRAQQQAQQQAQQLAQQQAP